MGALQDQARDEAYASAPADAFPLHVVELDTAAFAEPLFFISGVEDDCTIGLEDGRRVAAIATAFDMTPPGVGESGPTPAKLTIDNVSGRILPYLKQATSAIAVTYRGYLAGRLDEPVDLIEGLELKRVSLGGASAEGELTFPEITSQAFPRRTYDLDTYPGLWNA